MIDSGIIYFYYLSFYMTDGNQSRPRVWDLENTLKCSRCSFCDNEKNLQDNRHRLYP